MATALGPDVMLRTPTADMFDRPALMGCGENMNASESPLPSPQASPRNLPPPNPPFVFPARPSSSSAPSSAPSSYSRATGRRPRSVIDLKVSGDAPSAGEKLPTRSPALPAFSFNPGAALSPPLPVDNAFLSPPQSPASPLSPKAIPARPSNHGHRRGGSEFVGGSIRKGDPITIMSTSPTKSESGMASPTLAPVNPRRHAHRRSAAISSHDLSSIIMPPANAAALRGSSAPSSPAALDRLDNNFTFPPLNDNPSKSEPCLPTSSDSVAQDVSSDVVASNVELQAPPKTATRNRVGFSDTLEFIPRPLSLVSTDTSSTMTARPGHSVSGSISSIISAHNVDREAPLSIGPSPTRKSTEPRPSTAGAVLERTQSIHDVEPELPSPRRRGSIPYLGAIPPQDLNSPKPTSLSPTKTPKRWSFFGLEPFVASSPTRSRPVSACSSDSQPAVPAAAAPCDPVQDLAKATEEEVQKPATRKRSKKSKKEKKVKAWAGSILSRKAKSRHGKQKHRGQTPPPIVLSDNLAEEAADRPSLDINSEPETVMPTLLVTEELPDWDEQTWKAPRPASVPDDDVSYQMIDLDAALGPFATPLPRNPEWEASQRAGGFTKKQLHSANGMRGFSGPGMHYHRRAESAPEMVPFEAGRFGIHRFGSSSTMADVFEEDEEDEDGDASSKTTGHSTPLAEATADDRAVDRPSSVSGEEAPDSADQRSICSTSASQVGIKRKGSDLSEEEKPQFISRMKSEPSASTLHDEVIKEETPDFKMALVEELAGNESSGSVAPSPRQSIKTKDLAPVDVNPLHLPASSLAPISPYSMTQSSAFPSPRSPMSYDAHRISTAPSSITEDNFQSLLLGEPGPEVRISVDIDIPSLTSSNSTMTRESVFAHNPQARYPPLSDQPRPASFTSTAFGRRRSSLASLSRLISTSHGERSKLSMEVPLDSEPEKKTKNSKSKRFSRMMQFWKPKEKSST